MPILLVQDQYVDSDVNPVWNYEAHFPVEQPNGLTLQLEVLSNNHFHSSCPLLWLHIFTENLSKCPPSCSFCKKKLFLIF